MKVVLQRVSEAAVTVDGKTVGKINAGLMLLVGFGAESSREQLPAMASKIANMRIFPNEEGRFDRSLIDTEGEILLVPQFTLYADTNKGRRPEFFAALAPDHASSMFDEFVDEFKKLGIHQVETGVFGAMMEVSLTNSGPVTILLNDE